MIAKEEMTVIQYIPQFDPFVLRGVWEQGHDDKCDEWKNEARCHGPHSLVLYFAWVEVHHEEDNDMDGLMTDCFWMSKGAPFRGQPYNMHFQSLRPNVSYIRELEVVIPHSLHMSIKGQKNSKVWLFTSWISARNGLAKAKYNEGS